MKLKIKTLILLFISFISCSLLSGCGTSKLAFVEYNSNIQEFDRSLFYGNTEVMKGADPCMIYVPEKEGDPDSGFYYAYVTGSSTIYGWRTKDMTNWQYLDAVFAPDLDTFWAHTNFWAPGIYFDAEEEIYYMWYSATWNKYSEFKSHHIDLAWSKSPVGPFVSFNDGTEPLINFDKIPEDHRLFEYRDNADVRPNGYAAAIDAELFVDPQTNKKYMIYTHDLGAGSTGSCTYIMDMKSWTEPDYSSVKWLTQTGRTGVGANESIEEGNVNEGPFMIYHDGYYYLTHSVHTYTEPTYQVRQAVATSPTGPFRKIPVEEGGTVITTDGLNVYTNSSGHHAFIKVGDEYFISYHTFLNDSDISQSRKIKFDKVLFVTNPKGIPVIYTNGPTMTLQPLPSLISGYENKALDAEIYADKPTNKEDIYWLNDGTVRIHEQSIVSECSFEEKTKITLKWNDYTSIKSILVYNSYSYHTSFTKIDNIKLYFRDGDYEGVAETGELLFNYDLFAKVDYKCIYAGSSVAIQFKDLDVNKVEIFISESKGGEKFSVSEITVLGKKGE